MTPVGIDGAHPGREVAADVVGYPDSKKIGVLASRGGDLTVFDKHRYLS